MNYYESFKYDCKFSDVSVGSVDIYEPLLKSPFQIHSVIQYGGNFVVSYGARDSEAVIFGPL